MKAEDLVAVADLQLLAAMQGHRLVHGQLLAVDPAVAAGHALGRADWAALTDAGLPSLARWRMVPLYSI